MPRLRAFPLLAFAFILPSWSLPSQTETAPEQNMGSADADTTGKDAGTPRVTLRMEPNYPSAAATVPGTVVMTLVIDKTGVPRKVQVKQHLTDEEDSAAVEAVKQWRWRPGVRGGRPVEVKATVAVTFHRLDDKK